MYNNRRPSTECFHSKDGICSKCVQRADLTSGKAFYFVNSNEEEQRKNINVCSDGKLEDVFRQHNHKIPWEQVNAELLFVNALFDIGNRLRDIPTKQEKSRQLIYELFMINYNLPARIWLSLYSEVKSLVLRIPYTAGCVLNSKDRAPYCVYVEVLEVEDIRTAELPQKIWEADLSYRLMPVNNSDSALISVNIERMEDEKRKLVEKQPMNMQLNGLRNTITSSSSTPSLPYVISATAEERRLHANGGIASQISRSSLTLAEHTCLSSSGADAPEDVAVVGKSENGIISMNIDRRTSLTMDDTENDKMNVLELYEEKRLEEMCERYDDDYGIVYECSTMTTVDDDDDSDAPLSPTRLNPIGLKKRRPPAINPTMEDPSAFTMSEPWEEKEARIRSSSPYGHLPNWRLMSMIVKTGDDLRQELLAYQLLSTLQKIWQEEKVPLYLRPYRILLYSHNSGLIEPIPNACSLHQIKRNLSMSPRLDNAGQPYPPTLLSHFFISYGSRLTENFRRAQENFVRSCAAYCLVSYFLQLKDRHNGNILLDHDGHLIHIDFGYILSMSPRNLGFETSPFKLTQEVIDVMFGTKSEMYTYFKRLMLAGLITARKHHERLLAIVETMINGSQLPCFRGGANVVRTLRDRFHINYTDMELQNLVDWMVEQSRDSLTTRLYDNFQYYTNGIF